ncbi:MAG: SDR family oxidoreductase [archaeon]
MNNKKILVIGGSGGIGREIVKELNNKDHEIITADKEILNEIDLDIKNIKLDVTNLENVKEIFNSFKDDEKISALVYCVSSKIEPKRFSFKEWKDFETHLNTQIKGFFNVYKEFHLKLEENAKAKVIVILTEYCFGKPPTLIPDYVSSKYALMGFVKSLASEISPNKCTFNMVSPGPVKTNLLSNFPDKFFEILGEKNPQKKLTTPKDVANAVSFLLDEKSENINGVNLLVNGGEIFN